VGDCRSAARLCIPLNERLLTQGGNDPSEQGEGGLQPPLGLQPHPGNVYCIQHIAMYSGFTVPFVSALQRAKHFTRHRHEFGVADEFEYERLADAFMTAPIHADIHECTNPTGDHDRNRLDGSTRHFGVAYGTLTIRTYHIRDSFSIAYRGGPAGFVAYQCAKVHP